MSVAFRSSRSYTSPRQLERDRGTGQPHRQALVPPRPEPTPEPTKKEAKAEAKAEKAEAKAVKAAAKAGG